MENNNKVIEKEKWNTVQEMMDENLESGEYRNNLMELGRYYSHSFCTDIKHLLFTLSRYKFACKLVMYKENLSVLELGCQEAVGSIFFNQNCKLEKYVGVDFDSHAIEWSKANLLSPKYEFVEANFLDGKQFGEFDTVISLDVIEHISKEHENAYFKAITDNLKSSGCAIVGTPNIALSPYARKESAVAHINLFSQERLYELASEYFDNVFIFNMNDEVVNTGFSPMSCYIFALCSGVKKNH